MSDARDGSGHRWSGWPGAFCMYCGAEDAREICLADGHDLDCQDCKQESCKVPDNIKDEIDWVLSNPGPNVGDRVSIPPQP